MVRLVLVIFSMEKEKSARFKGVLFRPISGSWPPKLSQNLEIPEAPKATKALDEPIYKFDNRKVSVKYMKVAKFHQK